MAEERRLRLGIDASGAQAGAQEWARSTDQIRARSKLTADGIRDLERSMGVTAQSFGRSGGQVSASARTALGSLFQYNQQIAASLKKTGDAANSTGNAIFAALQRAGSSVVSTGGNIRAGIGSLSGELSGAAGNAEGMAASLGLSAAAIGPIAALGTAVAALGYGLFQGTKNALQLEKSLTLIASRTDPTQFSRYEDAALDLSRALGVDSVQAAHAFTSALVSGFHTFEEQRSAATIGLKLFKTEGVDAATAVALLDNVLDSYGRTASQAARTTDQLLAGAKVGETTFQDMAQAVGIVGPVASGLGVELEQVTALLAGISPKVGGATNAAQGFSNLLLQLSDRTSAVNQELRKNGIEIDANAIRTRGFDAVLADVAKGLEGRESLLAQVFGSPRIARVALSALQEVGAKSEEVLNRIKQSADELNTSLDKVELLPTTRIEKAKAAVGAFFTGLGQSIKQAASDVPAALENGIFNDKLPTKTEQAYKLFELRLKETIGLAKEGTTAAYFQELGVAQKMLAEETKKASVEIREQAEFAKLAKEGLIPEPGQQGPELPKPPPPNLAAYDKAIGPEFDKSLQAARDSAEQFSASLDSKLGLSLDQEIAKLRESEAEVRRKIAAFQELGVDTEKLTAQLFGLVNQDDALAASMTEAAAHAKVDAESAKRTADARMEQSRATAQFGEASYAALFAARALTAELANQANQNAQFDQGPGQMLRDIELQNELIGKTGDETERLTALRQFDADAARLQAEAQMAGGDGFDYITGRIASTREELEKLLEDRRLLQRAEDLGHAIADPLTEGFESVILRTQSFGDALEQTYKQIVANLLKELVTKQLNKSLVGLFGGLFGGGGGDVYGPPAPSASGNVFTNGTLTPFAAGGVPGRVVPHAYGGLDGQPDVGSRPSIFRMANGQAGSIREHNKTEAIMPVLARGPSGRLGVELVGKSPQVAQPNVTTIDNRKTITIPITLNNPGDRRSRQQMNDDIRRNLKSV